MSKYHNEVKDTIQAITNKGFKLIKVDWDRGYGTEDGEDYIDCKDGNVGKATEAVLAVDDCHLFLESPSGDEVYVYFVLGNEPGVAVNDWLMPSDLNERAALDAAITEVSEKYDPDYA